MPKAKEFLNVVNAPLLSYPDWTLLSDIYDIPGLHCMTGIIAKLIGEIEKSFSDNEETREGTAFVDSFLEANNIHRTVYQGSHSFEGNHGRQLLKVINRMKLDTIQAFDLVVESCFSKELIGDYEGAIRSFSKLYMDLHSNFGVTVTVKAHLVMAHIIPQINKRHPG